MHLNIFILSTTLLATAVLARPSTLSTRTNHILTKRHFWCNGVDSETICPEGETMVPIDEYACDQISNAGRLGQITAPVNGEKSTTCQQQQQTPAQEPATGTGSGSLESTPFKKGSPVAGSNSLESTVFNTTVNQMHLTCMQVGGGSGGSVMLNCTAAA